VREFLKLIRRGFGFTWSCVLFGIVVVCSVVLGLVCEILNWRGWIPWPGIITVARRRKALERKCRERSLTNGAPDTERSMLVSPQTALDQSSAPM